MKTLITGGQVFDGAKMLNGHAVLVEGGKIAKLAPAGAFDGFCGKTIDAQGGTLLPGLIDCHTHILLTGGPDQLGPLTTLPTPVLTLIAMKNAQATLMGGITSLRDVGAKDFIDVAVRDAINRGDFNGPTIQCSGHLICMTGGHAWKIGREADGVDEVVKATREQLKGGVDWIKLMATGGISTPGDPGAAQFTEAEIAAACTEAARHGRRACAHAHGVKGILNAVRGGIASIEHGIFIDETCIPEMLKRGVYLVPTFSVGHWTLENAKRGTIPAFIVEKTEKVWATRKAAFKKFYDAGGKIAMGTDAGTQYNHHGLNAFEMKLMVEAGMTALDALIATTKTAAELMGLADRGRIADGLVADLLLVDGDPVAKIEMAALPANHRFVMKNGTIVKERAKIAA